MALFRWDEVEREVLSPTIARQVIHAEALTVARIFLKKGALVPEHAHVNEQVSVMRSGCLRFVVNGSEVLVRAGETLAIPPHVPHSAEALEDSEALDIFTPRREDWIRGDDAYLRQK
ncbi:MAG TPA: cupin domain-containing protein [Solibacterales bacterium]|nr:cupin domain-containing protein [Bryobacterales bacterium]